MTAFCSFGIDLRNGLDRNFQNRLTDGTPYFSSDMLTSSLILTFIWPNYSKSNYPSPFYSLEQTFSKSKSSSLFLSDKITQKSFFYLFFVDLKFWVKLQFPNNILGPIFFWPRKNPSICWPIAYSCHWSLNSNHQRELRYWRVSILWMNFGSEVRVNLKLHNAQGVPGNGCDCHYIIDQVSPRLLPWKFIIHL